MNLIDFAYGVSLLCLAIFCALSVAFAVCALASYLRRRKAATEASMKCFALSESPAVKASRNVH